MTDASTTQDNFILPAPPVGGLPISQDWLDRMKLVCDAVMCHTDMSYYVIPGHILKSSVTEYSFTWFFNLGNLLFGLLELYLRNPWVT